MKMLRNGKKIAPQSAAAIIGGWGCLLGRMGSSESILNCRTKKVEQTKDVVK